MLRYLLTLLTAFGLLGAFGQTVSERAAVRLTGTVNASAPSITLNWPAMSGTSSFAVYRKLKTGNSWGSAVANPSSSATQWVDNSVSVGVNYEYKVVRVSSGTTGTGYISTGINVTAPDYRGKVILLVDNTLASQLVPELNQLVLDMRADGWAVLRTDVSRTASVTSIRSIVQGHYNSDPANVKALYLVGHVPVPYSGNITPDGHDDGRGARPTDGYYADINGTWTDNSVNVTLGTHSQSWNTPGDGKFDQSDFPSAIELQVGRVDLYDMPAFSASEVQLVRNYLNKAHSFKVKGWTPTMRGLVIDNLQWVGNPIAASGFRMQPLAGNSNLTPSAPVLSYDQYVNGQSYLWTYHCGGGLQAVDNGVITYNGTSGGATTQQYASSTNMGGVFNMSLGSFYYDWDNRNNFLRAVIASGEGLANCWAGIPAWYFHHMGMGDNIGYSVLQTMNNTGMYTPITEGWQSSIGRTHLNLMGDPTIRMQMVSPPSNLVITNSGGNAAFSWTASADAGLGYHVYQFETSGAISRLTTNPVTGTSYLNPAIPFIAGRDYMVRAVKSETNFSGNYHNLSLGAIGTSAGSAAPDCLGVVGGSATVGSSCNDNNPCTTNDVYGSNCQCAGTPSPDSDGDGICNAQDNCPNIAGQIGSACNDNDPCTTNDVITANCQCAGTPSPDSDGDGICNSQDNCPNIAGQIGSACNDGNACTTGDVINANCQCVGTPSPDTDGDGVCNSQDNCPFVAGQIGTACNDNDPCTSNDVLNANCQCAGTPAADTDGDGVCDAQDSCPWVAGQIGSPCDDGDPCTTNDVRNSNCQCAGTPSPDSDGDGICNAQDNCPNTPGQIGSSCNDNDPCTTNDVLNSNCQCVGTPSPDTDGDGVCDTQDSCPWVAGQVGSPCDDGDPCTTNDVRNSNCQCAGTPSPDSDGDGICNAQDNCPNTPGQIGSSCNDNDPCTTNDVLNSNCQCVGTPSPDTDGDGVCDTQDSCPWVAGQVGSPCDDGDPCTTNDVRNSNCQCVGTPSPDTDGDGICNAQDNCPNTPGQIGSACNDNDPCTTNDVLNANCQCVGTPSPDTDGDGICNSQDNCPNVPGQIGSPCVDGDPCTINDVINANCQCAGTPSGDSDGDGICNALDDCPNTPGQIGSSCDDGNNATIDDVLNANCNCVGTLVVLDCLGVPNGPNLPGTPCNDGDDHTENDVWSVNCACEGDPIPLDCNGVLGGPALPG
ncbi:MAG TPA: thrombospondin type 3 repeat-containing protein, partial [Flavobacteriales bacterium]|nr:thrombospondin type 3 repeat-containing protein [Flavobacteriales bacterium]